MNYRPQIFGTCGHVFMRTCVFLVVAASLASCATPYQQVGFSGGYTERGLGNGLYRVDFQGNGYTSGQRAADLALLRTAEFSLEEGCAYFLLVDERNFVDTSTKITTPTTTTMTYGGGYASATTFGGVSVPVVKPSTSNVFRCFKEKPEGVEAYSSQTVLTNLSARYGITTKKGRFGVYFATEIPPQYEYQGGGAYVLRVVADRPMARSGIQSGDIVIEVGGTRIRSTEDVANQLGKVPPNSRVSITALRGSKQMTFDLVTDGVQ